MDTAVVGSRSTETVLTRSDGSRRPSQAEAEAAVRTLVEWAGDDPDREGLAVKPERLEGMKMMVHYWRIAFCALLASLLSATATAEPRSDIKVAAPWEIQGPDPATSGYVFLRMDVMETLIEADTEGRLQPGLATAWETSDGGETWMFSLRDGVSFHDGTPLTADVVVNALTRAAEQPGVLGKAPIAGMAAEGNTVVISLETPFAALPALLAHSSTVISSPAAFDADGTPVAVIGTGPYRVENLSPPQKMETVVFDGYWGEQPSISEATYLAAGRAETRALMAESGDADMVFTLDPSGFARLGGVDGVETVAVPIPRVMTLKVNAGHPFLAEAKSRQALSLAIDRKGIAAGITRFPEAAATQLFPPALGDWHDPAMTALAYDPAAAKATLKELGWVPGDDGILTRNGERFSLILRTFPDRPEQPLVAAALQDQWRAIGVELEVNVTNYSEIPAGHQDGSLEIGLFARNYGLTPDPVGTVLSDFSPGGGDWGAMNWEASEVAEAVREIASTNDPKVRGPLIETVVKALQSELPLIPIVWYQHTVAIADGLEGVVVDPFERRYGLRNASWATE